MFVVRTTEHEMPEVQSVFRIEKKNTLANNFDNHRESLHRKTYFVYKSSVKSLQNQRENIMFLSQPKCLCVCANLHLIHMDKQLQSFARRKVK